MTGDLIRQLTTGDRQIGSVSTSDDGLVMAYTVTDVVSPPEVYINRGDGSLQQRLTSFNDAWLADVRLQSAERLTWSVDDGIELEGWLIRPAGYEAGRLELIFEGPSSPGLSDERVSFFLAGALRKTGTGGGDESEQIVVHEVMLSELEAWLSRKVGEGLLIDMKVYAALYFACGSSKTH